MNHAQSKRNNTLRVLQLAMLPAIALFALAPITGCSDGPAENAGEEVDEAIEEAGDEIKDATDG
jgi:hypothetical protein